MFKIKKSAEKKRLQYKGYGLDMESPGTAAKIGFGTGMVIGGIIAGILGLAIGVAAGAHYERTK